ncbi:heterokaryon incompatibility protein-domain-containing protein [Boeremia exigua]|uniref:heterokaryon incompatibility protein-domain-containing protein n=1 Tax=Boeremia exigua TaxID=749465 RepID=UPI001E8EBB36|nr:heterokaryon incompatibility protein-domain-containing protein [Boeremia exigua]KAH6639038.1 heterokaryon incompatibility protein-domain-containing protein [Boeremia exigua]
MTSPTSRPQHGRNSRGEQAARRSKGVTQSPTHRKPYTYNSLHGTDTIRILRLEPGKKSDAIRGRLYESNLRHDKGADFEALSYTWGVADHSHTLSTPKGVIKISTNLAAALRRIRSETRSQHVWADAVCINQKDLKERGRQVKLMGQVYSTARRVLVWLGPDRHHRARAIFAMVLNHHQTASMQGLEELGDGLKELLRCEWFSRLWVVQEYHLARSALCMWGETDIDFRDLRRSFKAVVMTDNSYSPWVAPKERSFTVFELLSSIRGLQCSEERDRVYATLALPYRDTPNLVARIRQITPRYDLPEGRNMFEYARAFVESSCIYLLLSQVCHGPTISPNSHGLSWLPNLSTPAPGDFLPLDIVPRDTNMPEDLAQERVDVAHKTLYLTGWARTGTICKIGPSMNTEAGGSRLEDIAAFWKYHVYPDRSRVGHSAYIYKETLFAQVLACRSWKMELSVHWEYLYSVITRHSASPWSFALSKNALKMLRSLETSVTSNENYDQFLRFDPPQHYWKQRRLVKSAEGLIGMAPLATLQGDIIAHFPQFSLPCVLRPRDGHYLFVGTMFMPGLPTVHAASEGYRTFNIR